FDDEAAEVGDRGVDFFNPRAPPGGNFRIAGIEGVETTDDLGAVDGDGHRETHSPGAERVRDARDATNHFRREHLRRRIDIVHGATVDADRGEETRVVTGAGQVCADLAVVEKDGTAGVATLDGAVDVVPLIDPADRRCGRLAA